MARPRKDVCNFTAGLGVPKAIFKNSKHFHETIYLSVFKTLQQFYLSENSINWWQMKRSALMKRETATF